MVFTHRKVRACCEATVLSSGFSSQLHSVRCCTHDWQPVVRKQVAPHPLPPATSPHNTHSSPVLPTERRRLLPPTAVGDHVAAAKHSERAQTIAAKCRKHGDDLHDRVPRSAADLSDPLPRLEWMGVQRFVAGDNVSASRFFAQARELVWQRLKEQACADSKKGAAAAAAAPTGDIGAGFDRTAGSGGWGAGPTDGLPARGKISKDRENKESEVGAGGVAEAPAGEFHPDAMRLDRCMAVSICREGPEAF